MHSVYCHGDIKINRNFSSYIAEEKCGSGNRPLIIIHFFCLNCSENM